MDYFRLFRDLILNYHSYQHGVKELLPFFKKCHIVPPEQCFIYPFTLFDINKRYQCHALVLIHLEM